MEGPCEVRYASNPSGCERPHTHDYTVFCSVLKGWIRLRSRGTTHNLQPGQVACIPAFVRHHVTGYSEDFGGLYTLSVGQAAMEEAVGQLDQDVRIRASDRDTAQFLDLCRMPGDTSPGTEAKSHDVLYSFLATWKSTGKIRPFNAPGFIRSLKHSLDSSLDDPEAPERILADLPYSREHVNRHFREIYGESIQSYILNRKADRARELLGQQSTLTEAALRAGFYDQSHMTKVFKGVFQMTPRAYQKAIREADQSRTRIQTP